MANKASKGRVKKSIVAKGVSTGGPKKQFQRLAKKITVKNLKKNSSVSPPLSICVVPFHGSIFTQSDLASFVSLLGEAVTGEKLIGNGRVKMIEFGEKQILIPNEREDVLAILDCAKMADVLLCLFPAEAKFDNSCFDPLGYQLLSMLRQQGLPGVVLGSVAALGSKLGMKTVDRFFSSEFGEKGTFFLPNQVLAAAKRAREEPIGRRGRGYMLVEQLEVVGPNQVRISGIPRGEGFSTKTAVNLTGLPGTWMVRSENESEMAEMRALLAPMREAEAQEQTWPTDEELAENDEQDEMQDDEEDDDLDWVEAPVEVEHKFQTRTREEMEFVDEVDTPEGVSARNRFAKYRGLKSLRCGNWDPYEELPVDYSRIFEFQDIGGLLKDSLLLMKEGRASVGTRVCFVLERIAEEKFLFDDYTKVLVASTVAPNEAKMTVVHARVSRLPETAHVPIVSKQPVIVQCGFRRHLVARPIYSEIPKYSSGTGTCPIQRMHRTVPADASAVLVSFFALAVFGNNHTVLVFAPGEPSALLWGSMAGCAPNRPIVAKRITLTGYPFRVHQTKAVIRFMFFDPTDVDWFKPVELCTKKGLRGHILESLGTHGYMKCRFNGQLTSDDVVCMHLYKRVFPKFA